MEHGIGILFMIALTVIDALAILYSAWAEFGPEGRGGEDDD